MALYVMLLISSNFFDNLSIAIEKAEITFWTFLCFELKLFFAAVVVLRRFLQLLPLGVNLRGRRIKKIWSLSAARAKKTFYELSF